MTYDPRLVEVVDEVLKAELEETRTRVLKKIVEELGIDPRTAPLYPGMKVRKNIIDD